MTSRFQPCHQGFRNCFSIGVGRGWRPGKRGHDMGKNRKQAAIGGSSVMRRVRHWLAALVVVAASAAGITALVLLVLLFFIARR